MSSLVEKSILAREDEGDVVEGDVMEKMTSRALASVFQI